MTDRAEKETEEQKKCPLCETLNPTQERFCIKCSAELSGVMSFVSPPTVGGPRPDKMPSAPPSPGGAKKPRVPGKK